ncbi:MAG: hypothetical protein VX726_07495 [Planctomycetota bacterium]|nr:hypothetical protein [Planctomycetota bacterium]
MQCQFIKTCAALGTVGIAGAAFAGDTVRFDANFSDADIFFVDFAAGQTPANAQAVATADPGRYISSVGWSNVDVDICWNGGSSYTGWASEVVFALTMEEAGVTNWYTSTSPFAGDNTGADTPDTCSNRQALAEIDTPLAAFLYKVDASGNVDVGMVSTWNDGTGLRHSEINTADFYFVLGGEIPAGCEGATGSCGEAHPTPGCEDLSCCALTCDPDAGGDPFCCDSSWDSTCVELAVALCGIFQYSCDAPAAANDCATSPTMMTNGETVAFNTTGFNTDGPDEIGCGSGYEDFPIWSDAWYMVDVDTDSILTATCCNLADFDTKIAIYDAGPTGSTFDPATLPDVFLICNEDCDDPTFFTSEAQTAVVAGNSYLVRLGGYQSATGSGDLTVSWQEPDPPIPPQTCDTPGPDTITQSITDVMTTGGVACAGGGITTENNYCRVYTQAEVGDAFTIDCIRFGVTNPGSYLPAKINVYNSPSGSPAPLADMTLLASNDFGFYTTAGLEYNVVSFADGVDVDLSDGSALVVEIEIPPSLDGFVTFGGGTALDISSGTTYLRSGSCGITEYLPVGDIGFDLEWFVFIDGTAGGSGSCPGDFNGDGIVNGADFGSILAAWGTCGGCPEDLDGNGEVNGADVGLLLAVWGPCP